MRIDGVRWRVRAGAVLFMLLVSSLCSVSWADDRRDARALALDGLEQLENGDADAALSRFQKAEKLFHAPTHLLFIARALRMRGDLVEAHEVLVRLLTEELLEDAPEAFTRAQSDAVVEATNLLAKVPSLVVEVRAPKGQRVTVAVDGTPVPSKAWAYPIAVPAGEHVVTARGPEGDVKRVVRVSEPGQRVTVVLDLTPAPDSGIEPPSPSGFPAIGVTFFAVSIGTMAAAIITGVVALDMADTIVSQCPDDRCPPTLEGETDDALVVADASTGLFIAGGVLAAAGAVALILELQFEGGRSVDTTLELRPNGVSLRGTF